MSQTEVIIAQDPINSEDGEHGGDSRSFANTSDAGISDHESIENPNQIENDDSNAPLSSRGSTLATGDDDSLSLISRYARPFIGRDVNNYEPEDDKEPDGSPILTNKFLRDLFKKEHKKYYRTPYLNDKLFLHYKGFYHMKNLSQFTDLKCLYFEANGCCSLLGLE